MKKFYLSIFVLIAATALSLGFGYSTFTGGDYPWRQDQLIAPKDLAETIKNTKTVQPAILNVGYMENVKGAIKAGPAASPDGLLQFKTAAFAIPKDQEIVIYCGCCAFDHCPNIKPAFQVLDDAGYKNIKVLEIKNSLKDEWEKKGYPMN
jgi:hypothetical protein